MARLETQEEYIRRTYAPKYSFVNGKPTAYRVKFGRPQRVTYSMYPHARPSIDRDGKVRAVNFG
jgi:hypothetical protein